MHSDINFGAFGSVALYGRESTLRAQAPTLPYLNLTETFVPEHWVFKNGKIKEDKRKEGITCQIIRLGSNRQLKRQK